MSAADSAASPSEADVVHPIFRDALRISLSAKEYKVLHDHAVKRAPSAVQKSLPSPSRFEALVRPRNKHNEAAIRASLRIFLGSGAALKLADLIIKRLRGEGSKNAPRTSILSSPNFRLSFSLSLVLLLHRFLHRFFVRLRANLRTDEAQPFRTRNPRISKALTSRYAPAVGASAAGFALGISPQSQLRLSVAIYMSTKSLEFLYNALEEKGWFENRPWWFGSWLLMPISFAQLFHAFVFDRETVPKWFGPVLLRLSPSYIPSRPDGFPAQFHWPEKDEVVDSIATISNLRWPLFNSPILQPGNPNTLPASLKSISPITGPAHPSITSLSCALLHPSAPSCGTAFLHHILLSVPPLARLLTTVTLALSVLKFKTMVSNPMSAINSLSKRIITMTAVLSASSGAAWGSLCLWNSLLSRSTLPTKRFFLSGALSGLPFAYLGNSRNAFLSIFRAAIDSAWKAGVKRRVFKGWKGGDLWVIVLSWALIGAILESRPSAVQGKGMRKGLAWMKGDGFVDPVDVAARKKAKKASAQKKAETN